MPCSPGASVPLDFPDTSSSSRLLRYDMLSSAIESSFSISSPLDLVDLELLDLVMVRDVTYVKGDNVPMKFLNNTPVQDKS